MTCIAGIRAKDGTVYIGGDSCACDTDSVVVRRDPKVFRTNGGLLLGFCGSYRLGQVVRYHMPAFDPTPYSAFEAMVTQFVPALRATVEKHGVDEDDWSLLVAYNGGLFEVCDDYQVGESADGFAAIGSAYTYALGSLHSTAGHPERRIRKALSAAVRFSKTVLPPFLIYHDVSESFGPCAAATMAIGSSGIEVNQQPPGAGHG